MANMYPSKLAGGGTAYMEETTLWTNSSPTAGMGNSNVQLSDYPRNYDYIKFTFRWSSSDATEYSFILSKDEAEYGQTYKTFGVTQNRETWTRQVYPNSLMQYNFYSARKPSSTGETVSTTNLIPISIKGLKLKVQS